MPRVARIVLPGVPHHITQRGNNRQDVFFTDDDRRHYLNLLGVQSARFGLEVLGYCLMTNHIHLIATPTDDDSLAKAVGRTHFLYTQYINRFHGRSGHLWQNRFFSCGLDDVHTARAMVYVECNPVRAGMVRVPWRHRWSSASAHVNGGDATGLLDMAAWSKEWTGDEWKHALQEAVPTDELARIRLNTHRGRPLGTDRFLSRLEARLNRRLRPLPPGRPRRATAKPASRKPKPRSPATAAPRRPNKRTTRRKGPPR